MCKSCTFKFLKTYANLQTLANIGADAFEKEPPKFFMQGVVPDSGYAPVIRAAAARYATPTNEPAPRPDKVSWTIGLGVRFWRIAWSNSLTGRIGQRAHRSVAELTG